MIKPVFNNYNDQPKDVLQNVPVGCWCGCVCPNLNSGVEAGVLSNVFMEDFV